MAVTFDRDRWDRRIARSHLVGADRACPRSLWLRIRSSAVRSIWRHIRGRPVSGHDPNAPAHRSDARISYNDIRRSASENPNSPNPNHKPKETTHPAVSKRSFRRTTEYRSRRRRSQPDVDIDESLRILAQVMPFSCIHSRRPVGTDRSIGRTRGFRVA